MRKLAGYLCHRASVRLHEVAVGLLKWCDDQHAEPVIWLDGCSADGLRPEFPPIELDDIAPRLAAAVDVVRDKLQHAHWLAGIVGLERMTKDHDA